MLRFFCLLLLIVAMGVALTTAYVGCIQRQTFEATAAKPKVVIYTMPGCAPCELMKRELNGRDFPNFTVEFKYIGPRDGITRTPTLIKIDANGVRVAVKVGYLTPRELERWMAQ